MGAKKPEPAASGTGSYGFVDTVGEMVTLSIQRDGKLAPC